MVIQYNYLERQIDNYIHEIMNDDFEDEKVWIFLENLVASKKIQVLSKLYDIHFASLIFPEKLIADKKRIFIELDKIRERRNIYAHANWINSVNSEHIECKTKRMNDGKYYRLHKKISIGDLDKDLLRMNNIQLGLEQYHEEFMDCFCNSEIKLK